MSFHPLPTPHCLIKTAVLERNIRRMQNEADAAGIELWPHAKTHKMVEVARRQIQEGAKGLTCAKLGEAEALLPSGVRRIFLAHSLVGDEGLERRLQELSGRLDELILAVTSEEQGELLHSVLVRAGLRLPVAVAVDSGLGREGIRTIDAMQSLGRRIAQWHHFTPRAVYTHEGHFYGMSPEQYPLELEKVAQRLEEMRKELDPSLPLWPGCSVSARLWLQRGGVEVVRPGAYVFGDMYLVDECRVMAEEDIALTVIARIVDHPEPNLWLLNAGSKVFSSDRTDGKLFGRAYAQPQWQVFRLSEEHGFLSSEGGRPPVLGQVVSFVPAHVCPVINLRDEIYAETGGGDPARWTVEARGCVW